MAQITIKKVDDEKFFCPYCGEEVVELLQKEIKMGLLDLTYKYVYACSKCKKVLPVSMKNHF